jgi:hypothetical protein
MKTSLTYLLITACLLVCCKQDAQTSKSPAAYDLSKPEKFVMPESLLEISGICFNNGNNDTIYAIQDEEGKVFRMALGIKKQWHSKFSKQGDYEDVSIINGKIVILQSNGTLYAFPFADAIYTEVDSVQEWKHLLPAGEYEAMYGDEATGNLYVLCKNCATDNNKDAVSGYIVSAAAPAAPLQSFTIDVKSIKDITGKVKRGFRPSALAKNPITKEWFIVSAVNQILVVADSAWGIKDVYPLSGNIFNQPEGIAFDASGNMYISNEGDDVSTGNVLKFERVKQ